MKPSSGEEYFETNPNNTSYEFDQTNRDLVDEENPYPIDLSLEMEQKAIQTKDHTAQKMINEKEGHEEQRGPTEARVSAFEGDHE